MSLQVIVNIESTKEIRKKKKLDTTRIIVSITDCIKKYEH